VRRPGADGRPWRALLVLAAAAGAAACEEQQLQHHAGPLSDELRDTLMAHGVCASHADCSRRSALLWDPGPTILNLGVYGVREPRTVVALRAACVRYVDATPGAPRVLLRVYRVYRATKAETLRGTLLFPAPDHEITCARRPA